MRGWLTPSVTIQMLLQISISLAEYLYCSRQNLRVGVFFFLSVTNIIVFRNWCWYSRNAVAGVARVRSQEYRRCQAVALAALIDSDISVCRLYPAPFLPYILGSWGFFPKKTSAVWPFCSYHKDVSNLLKLSRNDKSLPRWLCWCKHFLHQQRSRIYVR